MTSLLQRDLRAGQARLDIKASSARPLIPLEAVMFLLDRDEDDVAMLIQDRLLRYAFDIRSRDAERSCPVVAATSVRDYAELSARGDYRTLTRGRFAAEPHELRRQEAELRRVVEGFYPHGRKVLRTPEIARLLSCSKQHIHDLVSEGLLVATKAATVNTSAEITRLSLTQFLISRRMPLLKGPKPT